MLPVIFLVIFITAVLAFFSAYFLLYKKSDPVADAAECECSRLEFPHRRYPMAKNDVFALIALTCVYAVVAFAGLGSTSSPTSACTFEDKGSYVVIELPGDTLISRISYFSGLHTGNYYLQYSDDGESYEDVAVMEQKYTSIYKWNTLSLSETAKTAKYLRIIADAKLQCCELCLYDWAGDPIPASSLRYNAGCAPLLDEQSLVPAGQTYMNSTYFDEIYHVRTASENLQNVYPYEVSHPPLGKEIISLGIRLFGLNPFGWRFMGVLFGILMLPFLYVFLKNLFGFSPIAFCGTAIFAFDFMHFVQTRIATIDTYGVFFILLMYFFMYRYLTAPRSDHFSKKSSWMLPLFLSGLCFGLGCACKWTVIYGGAGLAVIWLLFRIFRGRELLASGHGSEHKKELTADILICLVSFVIIPVIIYYLSYYPYGKAAGLGEGASVFFKREYADIVLQNQKFMFTYHAGVTAEHPYSARWYQWIVDARPILYYLESLPNNCKSSFADFMNPVVCWGGLLAMFAMVWRTLRYRDGKALFILIGYLSGLVPWMFITRITFEYHYFPCLIFLVLALCHVFNGMRLRDRHWKPKVYGYTAVCLVLFAAFYPVLTGVAAPRWYTDLLAWIPGAWPF